MNRAASRQGGFTLIEVALAVLAMGLGILVVFSLIPSSLRLAEDDRADTRCGQFTEVVMHGMLANATTITNWADWTDPAAFTNDIVRDVLFYSNVFRNASIGGIVAVPFPNGGNVLRYRLTIEASRPSAKLEVCDGQYGPFDPMVTAYTEFTYQGD